MSKHRWRTRFGEGGLAFTESALVTTALIGFFMLIFFDLFSKQQGISAAKRGSNAVARAASQGTDPADAKTRAKNALTFYNTEEDVVCTLAELDLDGFEPGSLIRARVTCRVPAFKIRGSGVNYSNHTNESFEVIDTYGNQN